MIENLLGTSYSYSIVSSLGQQIVSGSGQGLNTSVDVERLPPGLYVLIVKSVEGTRFSQKFVKE